MDDEFDDAALWAVIDSAAASYTTSSSTATTTAISKYRRPHHPTLNLKSPPPKPLLVNTNSPSPSSPSPSPSSSLCKTRVVDNRPLKISRSSPYSPAPQFNVTSPSPVMEYRGCDDDSNNNVKHCLAGQYPSVSLFKDYQDAAMSILDKSDYSVISGNPFIKKSGWRKIAFYFSVSFEIRDKSIEFDDNRNVVRAEFVARAYMQGGRFSDGWGSCERREKKFLKPNHDVPSTAETRAKNRACQDLLGIGQYRPGVNHSNPPRSH